MYLGVFMRKSIIAFYKFVDINDPNLLKSDLNFFLKGTSILGTIILSKEGINGMCSSNEIEIKSFKDFIFKNILFSDIDIKESFYEETPFKKMSIKIKNEIVPIGDEEVKPSIKVGKYVEPEKWDEFISHEDVVLIDTRNDFEVKLGSFYGSVNPETKSFREFPLWWRKNKDKYQGKKIAMFCTGGIRCEKSTSYLINNGVKDVFHLKGGILNYFEKLRLNEKSKWKGECFVFDQRVSLTPELMAGNFELCFGCRNPINEKDKVQECYEPGVTCPNCHDIKSEKKKSGLRERQKQALLNFMRKKKKVMSL